MQADWHWMAQALALARLGRFTTTPNPRVGCVIVKDGQLVGEGYHRKAGEPHAEVHALRMAGDLARGATAYVTLEPCSHHGRTPPCADALIAAGVTRVVAAMEDPNPLVAGRGLRRLAAAGIQVASGLMEADALALNAGFVQRMRSGRPRVTVKLAASLDGRTALANGQSQWITGPQARADVQLGRAQACAILTGADTVLTDDPALNVRWAELPESVRAQYAEADLRQPIRVIVDGQQRVTADARLFSLPGPIWLAREQVEGKWPAAVSQVPLPREPASGKLSLPALLDALGARGINELWVEAGRQLAGALLSQSLVDELLLYQAPLLMGEAAQGLLSLPVYTQMSQAPRLELLELRQLGQDIRLRLRPQV
ncbi:bifunctional diaminohydroxyphosphoribosylaminopyrimidine deaminase/5-amino-6-(5-phosphoribosylamino)uracil reductase RibD [Pseudaeromonas paramecii]|uniref:Riboflavin biosynthesis protein RibD n=1 Tax=Pseudaeromonas paramecii TaxID=2138166 RepID=A0ABP8QCH2_9GAMM